MRTDVTFNSAKYGSVTASYRRMRSYYLFTVLESVTEAEAMIIQSKLGFAPAGYNFYDYKLNENGASWKCWLSCD